MRAFTCPRCGQSLFFENSVCLRCGSAVGYDRSARDLVLLEDRSPCVNLDLNGCNWIPDEGEQFDASLDDLIAKGPLLLIFYQDDGMPICTSELKAFAQEYPRLENGGVQVIAINSNGLGSHRKFQERDHYPFAWSAALAGGGIVGGQALGKTSRDGTTVEERPVTVPNFLATVCKALGIDPQTQNVSNTGRPISVVDSAAKPVEELLG